MEKCVLIYDDDESILYLCKTILTKSQYRVEVISRCDNVISDIDRIKPDIILMDLWIPDTGGEIAIGKIKEAPSTKHIPVILFSANSEIKQISERVNANGYLEKPFNIATLKETVEKNLL